MTIKPTFVLSGLSGVGKSTLIEHTLLMTKEAYSLKSFTKFLLDNDFGVGKSQEHLIIDSYMNAYHAHELLRDDMFDKTLLVERSIIDAYFMHLYLGTTEVRVEPMNQKISNYFKLITKDGLKPLYIIDIRNYDDIFIKSSLCQNNFRSNAFKDIREFYEKQDEYKSWFFNKLDELNIKYETLDLSVMDIDKFNSKTREEWITDHILNA